MHNQRQEVQLRIKTKLLLRNLLPDKNMWGPIKKIVSGTFYPIKNSLLGLLPDKNGWVMPPHPKKNC